MKILSVITVFLCLSVSVFAEPGRPASDTEKVIKFTGIFINYVRLNDMKKIFDIGGLDKKEIGYTARFLTEKGVIQGQIDSMSKLISDAETIAVMPVKYSDKEYEKFGNGFTIFFIKKNVSLSAVLNKKKRWLVDYAACDFFVNGNKISYGMTFCYNGTEGPFFIPFPY